MYAKTNIIIHGEWINGIYLSKLVVIHNWMYISAKYYYSIDIYLLNCTVCITNTVLYWLLAM